MTSEMCLLVPDIFPASLSRLMRLVPSRQILQIMAYCVLPSPSIWFSSMCSRALSVGPLAYDKASVA